MIRKVLIAAFSILLFASHSGLSQASQKATLEITFKELRGSKGNMVMGISSHAKGWPRNAIKEQTWKKSNGKGSTMTVIVEGLEYGTYALSVLDDEDSDGDMTSFLGIPKEGYGFSRDAPVKMSAPDFEDCVIEISRPYVKIDITINYLQKNKKTE